MTAGVRLTRSGVTVAALALGLVAVGYLLGYPPLALLGVAGLAALAASAAGVAIRPDVELAREIFPLRVTRGETAVGMLMIRNRSRWSGLRLDVRETVGPTALAVGVPYLPRRARREVGYQLPTGRRGVIDVGPLQWEQADLFGLLRRQQSLAGTQRLYVHPAVHPFALGAAVRSRRWDNGRSDAALNGTITFHALREYVPGDDLRHIHWRSSARLDTLMVRQNIDVSLPAVTVLLVTDPACYTDAEQFEWAVEVTASVLIAAVRDRLPARLLTSDGGILRGRGGPDDARMFLDQLAAAALCRGVGLLPATDQLDHAEAGGMLLIAAGSLDGQALGLLRRVAARYDPAVLALAGEHGPARQAGSGEAGAAGSLAVIGAPSAADFCGRWNELARR